MTLQSFLWSKRLKEQGTEQQAAEAAARGEAAMSAEPNFTVDSIFSFRQGGRHAVHCALKLLMILRWPLAGLWACLHGCGMLAAQ